MTYKPKRSVFFVLLMLLGLIVPVFSPASVSAHGESYKWSGDNIQGSGGSYDHTVTFNKQGDGTYSATLQASNFKSGLFGCVGHFVISNVQGNTGSIKNADTGSSCGDGQIDHSVTISGTAPASAAGGASQSGNPTQTPDQQQETQLTLHCKTSLLNPLTWLVCPMVAGIQGIINHLDSQITSFLEVPEKDFKTDCNANDTASCPGASFYKAWAAFRTIALVVLVIFALIMVISQAIAVGPFDAYTIKRLLPRIFVAVILVSISWSLMAVFVAFTNDLGKVTRGIIIAPFGGGNINLSGTTGALGIAAIAAAGFALGLFGLLSLALTAFLAVIIAFAILLLRQIVVIMLIIIAPLAIMMYVLPNTKRYADLWQDSFVKALLMFPIIEAFIAAGRVFAKLAVMGDPQGSPDTTHQIIAFAAYFAPYFMLPYAFRLAGGALSTLSGMVNDRGRGAFDRLKGFRQKKVAQNWEDTKAGNRFKGNTALSRRASSMLQTASLTGAGGFTLDMDKRRARMQTARASRNFDLAKDFLEKNEAARAIKGDDDKLWAVMNGDNENEVRKILQERAPERFSDPAVLNQAVAEVMRFKREAGDKVGRVAATVAQAGTGTGYNYRFDGVEDDMFNAIIAASGDDRGLSGRMLAEMRQSAMQSGRVDIGGGGFAKAAQIMDKRRAALGGGPAYSADEARHDVLQDVLQSNGGAAVAGKVEGVKQLAPVMKANLDAALQSGDTKFASREFAKLAGKYDAAAQVAPQNAEALADGVLAKNIDLTSLPNDVRDMLTRQVDPRTGIVSHSTATSMTYQQAIEQLRSNSDFQTLRREYQQSGVAAAVAAQQAAQQQPGQPPGGIPPIAGQPPTI